MRLILFFLFVFVEFIFFSQKDTTIFVKNSGIFYKGKILNDKKIGNWKKYNSHGKLLSFIEILDDDNKCKITYVFDDTTEYGYSYGLFFNDSIILDGKMELINEKEKSKTIYFFNKGQKIGQELHFNNDKLTSYHCYYPTTKNHLYTPIKNNGNLNYVSFLNYKGFLNGPYTGFDDSMRVSESGSFNNGAKVGQWYYFRNGILESKGEYFPDLLYYKSQNDTVYIMNKDNIKAENIYSEKVIDIFIKVGTVLYLKTGKWEYNDELGNLIKLEYYNKGELIKVKKVKLKKKK
jgi:hypothetical protein